VSDSGLVVSVGSRSCRVHLAGRGEVRCTLRGLLWDDESAKSHPVAAGDRVEVAMEGEEGVIERVEPRSNYLARPVGSSGRRSKSQVIAANIDRLLVIAALDDPPFRPGLVDRFLVAAAMQEIHPVLVLNKVDLERPDGPQRDVVAPYREFGIEVLESSTTTGEGIEALARLLASGVSLLVGHSGVGKSSLLNAVSPGLQRSTGDVTEYHGRGRHTTTAVTLLALDAGGWVVDSPGIREFAVGGIEPADLARLYPGFGGLPEGCRFSDCLHRKEPGCAIRAAIAAGELNAERHERYLRLLEEVEARVNPFA
jgi:ribosome biogenesis GTPase